MPNPSGPAPAITTKSSSSISPRWTAWMEQPSGSMNAAWAAGMLSGTRKLMASAGRRTYWAMAPKARWRKP